MKKTILFLLLVSITVKNMPVYGQNTQTIKGQIVDKESKYPLIGVTVSVIDVDPVIGTATDEDGNFKLLNVPQGRRTIKVSYLGYKEQTQPNIMVTSGKETIIDFQLTENVVMAEEIVVKADADKTQTNNDMAVISARSFNLEEAQRYAGSLNDPARMASNFAGVGSAGDNRNDIVVRGNSPLGLLWRLEGVEIPNPNHFGSLGSSGGPISMLNTNQLGRSDFMTSAFPANYGNATGGVFDLTLRRPNNEKHEFMGQFGFNGLELGAEGPFSKKSKASYMVNYRYSTLGIMKAAGFDFGTGAAIPQYQDVSFKVDLPTQKSGKFSFFGLGGLSNIELLDSKIDTTKKGETFYNDGNQDVRFNSNMGVIGASHTYFFNPTLSSKLVIALSGNEQPVKVDSVIRPSITIIPNYQGAFSTNKVTVNFSINKKFSNRNTLNTGINIDRIGFNLVDKNNISATIDPVFRDIRNNTGANFLGQAWVQWQHKFSERTTLNSGLHGQLFSLNTNVAVEPRLGLRYQFTEKIALNVGSGVHNQTQPIFMYYNRAQLADGSYIETNKNLKFTTSYHAVAGFDYNISTNWRVKMETYYQNLMNIPIENSPSPFSMANVGADFNLPGNVYLVNDGKGYNYGVELTIEKFFANGFYLLQTTSLFESKYKGSDNVWRNTAFNSNYVANILGGYELKLGKKNTFSIDLKGSFSGGRRVTPIDEAASKLLQRTVYITSKTYEEQLDDYMRFDLRIGYRRDGKKISQQWLIQFNNITDHKNIFLRRYSQINQAIVDVYQLPFQVIPQYRILF